MTFPAVWCRQRGSSGKFGVITTLSFLQLYSSYHSIFIHFIFNHADWSSHLLLKSPRDCASSSYKVKHPTLSLLSLLMLNFFQACEWIFNHGRYTRFSGTQSHYYYRSTIDLSRCNRQPRFQSDITLQRSGTDQQSRHRQRIIVVANRCYKMVA